MKRLLLASAAILSLAVAAPAFAQITEPLPATPPIVQPTPNPDVTTEESAEVEAQAPVVQGAAESEAQAEASAMAEPPSVGAQAAVAGEVQPTPQTESNVQSAAPPVTAETQTDTMTPAAPPAGTAQTTAPAATADTTASAQTAAQDSAMAPAFANANAVCQPRVTSVHFGQRGSALSRQNGNAIEHAVDAASVCTLQQVTIADSAEGSTSSRRAAAVRAALVRQGVPEDRIIVAQEANAEGVTTGQLDVRMTFAGVEDSSAQVASAPMAQPMTQEAPAPVQPTEPQAEPQTEEEEQPTG